MRLIKFCNNLFSTEGTVSCMRVMSMAALWTAAVLAFVGLMRGSDLTGLSLLAGVFVGAAFGGKVMQSSVESKETVNKEEG